MVKLYLDGYKASYIAEVYGQSSRSVQRVIREYKKLLTQVELDRVEQIHKNNRKIIQELDKENKAWMSNNTTASKNKSMYRTNKYGDLVLKVEECKCPFDMPRKIINTEHREYRKTFKCGKRKIG